LKIGRQDQRSSAISTSNEHTIVVRGRDLAGELIGAIGFTDHIWLLIAGALPTPAQRRVLGSAEAAGQFLAEIASQAANGGAVEAAVGKVVGEYRAANRAIPGYGHPLHKGQDPRARRLFEVAAEAGTSGRHVEIARSVERQLPQLVGRTLAINVSGAIPAVLLDAGYPLRALKGIPILARTASLIAHLLEEQQRPIGFVLSHAAVQAIDYDGSARADFVPSANSSAPETTA
jgi:citrate synthase